MRGARNRIHIAALGSALGPDTLGACRTLFEDEQNALAVANSPIAADQAYGGNERHRLDLYGITLNAAPVVLFVHGGGFRLGDKSADGWANAAVGRWAASQGWLGAVMNYRLAPEHQWPAGGEDVLAAVDWLSENAGNFGGDPRQIVLVGTSAGAVHIATALRLRPQVAVRGCVLLSGLYGYTPLEERDTIYFGAPGLYEQRMPREAVAGTELSLFVACAEFDPPRFQAEFLGLMKDRLSRHGAMPRGFIASGHNHYTMAMHIGTTDSRLSEEIGQFIFECCV